MDTELSQEEIEIEKSKYTRKIYSPIYEPKGEKPLVKDLFNADKANELISEINADKDLDDELREFLILSAQRHISFNFSKIAEFYAHLPVKYKKHFENSGLVIIDYDKALRNGFIAYDNDVQKTRIEYLENEITMAKMIENKTEVENKRTKQLQEELDYLKSEEDEEDTLALEEW